MASRAQARQAKEAVVALVGDDVAVAGVGVAVVAGGGYAVKVNLARPLESDRALPDEVGGVPVIVEVVGTIRPL